MEIMTDFPMIKNWKKITNPLADRMWQMAISIKSEMKNEEDEI